MKKVIGIIFIVFTVLALSSCKGKSSFKQLYYENFETASNFHNNATKIDNFMKYEKYNYRQYHKQEFDYQIEDADDVLDNYKFKNIIICEFTYNNEGHQVEIVECRNEEDAKNISEELSWGMYKYYYRENIVYNSTAFSVIFMDGVNIIVDDSIMYSNDMKMLVNHYNNINLEEFKLPESLEVVCEYGLYYISSIKKIICNDNLKKITRYGMAAMWNLEEVELNEGLLSLGKVSFTSCKKLRKIDLPSTLIEINNYAFYDCESLEYVVIPKNVEYIGYGCFNKTTLYCEVESQPEEWAEDFIVEDAKVYWAGEWEYNEDGIPVPILIK